MPVTLQYSCDDPLLEYEVVRVTLKIPLDEFHEMCINEIGSLLILEWLREARKLGLKEARKDAPTHNS
jgi:hypothetical protein